MFSFLSFLAALAIGAHYTHLWTIPTRSSSIPSFPVAQPNDAEKYTCRPFLPKLLVKTPPSADHPIIQRGSERLGDYFAKRFAKGDIDSLSIAVVSSNGSLFEQNYGVLRGNETATSPPTTRHSMYRIASISKLFAVLQGLVLEQRGVISWNDPVEKYLPNFKYHTRGFDPSAPSSPNAPITLFQLATHTSGLGRDWPTGNAAGWPKDVFGGGPPPMNGLPFPSHASLYKAISEATLVSPPSEYPSYSNTAAGLLGIALVAANRAASKNPTQEPTEWAQLIQRDVFDAMGLNGSHFLTTEANKHLVVTPSLAPEVADEDFRDAMNAAGGQFTSLADAVTLVETLLNPIHPKSMLTPATLNKWLQPAHSFDEDNLTEMGLMWEIIKAYDSNNRLRKIYWKLGIVAGYYSVIAIHPSSGYGVVVLLGGNDSGGGSFDAAKLAYDAFEIFQPAIDAVLAEAAASLYAGQWYSEDTDSSALITIEKGTLYMERFISNGTNILEMFQAAGRLALRSSHRRDELRIDTGIPGYNNMSHMGCYPYWNGQDMWGMRNGFPFNLLYFTGDAKDRTLHFPSTDVIMRRVV